MNRLLNFLSIDIYDWFLFKDRYVKFFLFLTWISFCFYKGMPLVSTLLTFIPIFCAVPFLLSVLRFMVILLIAGYWWGLQPPVKWVYAYIRTCKIRYRNYKIKRHLERLNKAIIKIQDVIKKDPENAAEYEKIKYRLMETYSTVTNIYFMQKKLAEKIFNLYL